MPRARRAAVAALARRVASGSLDLGGPAAAVSAELLEVPGVGPWTASYVALRALGDRDAFPAGDLGLRRAARALGLPGDTAGLAAHAERWRPWRAYAAHLLWALPNARVVGEGAQGNRALDRIDCSAQADTRETLRHEHRHRSPGDTRVARRARCRRRPRRPAARPAARRTGRRPRAPRRRAAAGRGPDAVRQHDPDAAPGALSGRPRPRAQDPLGDPLELDGDGHAGQQGELRARRAHRELPVGGDALRGRLQPLLARAVRGPRGRPGVHPGPLVAGHLRARVPRGPADRGAAQGLPPGGRRQRAVLLSAPLADAGLLAVPHRLDGARADHGHLPGALHEVPPGTRPGRHFGAQGVGLPRRRRDRRARVARGDLARRTRAPGQPRLRRQLQPAAPRRPGPRQRQDHPGARDGLPRRGLERHQGHLGPALGPAAGGRPRRPAREADERGRRRRVPDVQGAQRRVRARALLRALPGAARPGRGHERRPRSGTSTAAATTPTRSTRPTRRRRARPAARRSSWPRRSRATGWASPARARTSPISRRR